MPTDTTSIAPPPVARREVHHRQIHCRGFARDDGLYDIEGTLIDTKPTLLALKSKDVPAGEPIHQMRVVLTIDRERLILDARAHSDATPYASCHEVEDRYRQLIGLRIEPGFVPQVKRLFRGVAGYTHMTELIAPMASTAFQVLWAEVEFDTVDDKSSERRTSPLGTCHALRLDGQVIRTYFPQFLQESSS